MSQVVVLRDCVYYEEFVQTPAPGHSVYEGSPLIGRGAWYCVNAVHNSFRAKVRR